MVLEGCHKDGWCSLEEGYLHCFIVVTLGGNEENCSLLPWEAMARQTRHEALEFKVAHRWGQPRVHERLRLPLGGGELPNMFNVGHRCPTCDAKLCMEQCINISHTHAYRQYFW